MRNIIFTCFLAIFLTACGQKDKVDIAVLSNSMSNPYWKTIYDGASDTAKTLGKSVYIQTLAKVGDAEEQANQCENALLRQPKAIVFAAVNQVNLIPCLQKATHAGVVLVDMDGNFSKADAEKNGLNVAFSVGSNNYDLGKLAAEYVKKITGKVLVIEGAAGSYPSIQRVAGFRDNIPSTLTVVATLRGDWDMLKAANITNDTLTTHSDLTVVFAANDQMALGAVEALATKGHTNVTVLGVDGNIDAVKAIKEDKLTASMAQLPYLMAKQALEKTAAYLDNPVPVDYNQYVPILALDKAALESKNDLLQYVR